MTSRERAWGGFDPLTTLSTPAQQTMSSLEIAELTGKEHKNVLADIRKMLGELSLAAAEFSATARVPGPNGSIREVPCFHLPKDLTITLVTGYSIPMRHAVVTRLAELEARVAVPALPNFSNPAEAARAWAAEFEQKQVAQVEVARLAPVAAVGELVCSHEHPHHRHRKASCLPADHAL